MGEAYMGLYLSHMSIVVCHLNDYNVTRGL